MWQNKDGALYKQFEFTDFKQAFAFMTAVAKAAEAQKHHPKWLNEYNKVEIWLSTHGAGGKITGKDRKLAGDIDDIYKGYNR
jgi:4a-hydroxytetrahydrobiopterin dehydratase